MLTGQLSVGTLGTHSKIEVVRSARKLASALFRLSLSKTDIYIVSCKALMDRHYDSASISNGL